MTQSTIPDNAAGQNTGLPQCVISDQDPAIAFWCAALRAQGYGMHTGPAFVRGVCVVPVNMALPTDRARHDVTLRVTDTVLVTPRQWKFCVAASYMLSCIIGFMA